MEGQCGICLRSENGREGGGDKAGICPPLLSLLCIYRNFNFFEEIVGHLRRKLEMWIGKEPAQSAPSALHECGRSQPGVG